MDGVELPPECFVPPVFSVFPEATGLSPAVIPDVPVPALTLVSGVVTLTSFAFALTVSTFPLPSIVAALPLTVIASTEAPLSTVTCAFAPSTVIFVIVLPAPTMILELSPVIVAETISAFAALTVMSCATTVTVPHAAFYNDIIISVNNDITDRCSVLRDNADLPVYAFYPYIPDAGISGNVNGVFSAAPRHQFPCDFRAGQCKVAVCDTFRDDQVTAYFRFPDGDAADFHDRGTICS